MEPTILEHYLTKSGRWDFNKSEQRKAEIRRQLETEKNGPFQQINLSRTIRPEKKVWVRDPEDPTNAVQIPAPVNKLFNKIIFNYKKTDYNEVALLRRALR